MAVLAIAGSLLIGSAILSTPVAAHASVPTGVYGTYSWHDSGYAVTVGYSPCGLVDPPFSVDPRAVWYMKVSKGGGHGGSAQYWAHDINDGDGGDLKSVLANSYGLVLRDQAVAVLTADASTYVC
jgi:hypothetical protein